MSFVVIEGCYGHERLRKQIFLADILQIVMSSMLLLRIFLSDICFETDCFISTARLGFFFRLQQKISMFNKLTKIAYSILNTQLQNPVVIL